MIKIHKKILNREEKKFMHGIQKKYLFKVGNKRNLASTNTSAVMAWRRELAYAAADLSSFSFQRRVSLGMILAID